MNDKASALQYLAVVVIGRNEGRRLAVCLQSVRQAAPSALVVYVDSGSTDGSVALAKHIGCEVVELDMRQPFTAARARNAGYGQAVGMHAELAFVQFMDGDCEMVGDWLDTARAYLDQHAEVAVVCGRRRERYPQNSLYNQFCDIEWNTQPGQASSCGGDAMIRLQALQQVAGFREDLIAGEEPEMCVRIRAKGWKVWRLDHEMTLHDAAILRFSQWWQRCKRSGYAFAAGHALHGGPPEYHWAHQVKSVWLWGLLLPATTLAFALTWSPWFLLAALAYPVQAARIYTKLPAETAQRKWYAIYLMLGKFPEMLGVLKFQKDKLLGARSGLIEYKK
jgi:GT2 family glycosyltransferase